jgi:hypothetical protein
MDLQTLCNMNENQVPPRVVEASWYWLDDQSQENALRLSVWAKHPKLKPFLQSPARLQDATEHAARTIEIQEKTDAWRPLLQEKL